MRTRSVKGVLVVAVVAVVLAAACTDDADTAAPVDAVQPPTTEARTTTTSPPPDAVIKRTQVIVTADPPDPATLTQLATAIRARFVAAGEKDARTTVIGPRIVVDVSATLDLLDAYALAATDGRIDFRPVLALLPTCPAGVPPPAPDQPSVLPLRKQADGCARVGPVAPVTIEGADAGVEGDHWAVSVNLGEAGRAGLSQIFAACFAKDATCPTGVVALAVDDRIEGQATAEQPTFDKDSIAIGGGFDGIEAMRIAHVLSAPLPRPVRVIEPPVEVKRRVVGPQTAAGQGTAVLLRYGSDDDLSGAVERAGDALAAQMTRLAATAVFLTGDDQLGELVAVVVSETDASTVTAAVTSAAEIDDPTRVVTMGALVP